MKTLASVALTLVLLLSFTIPASANTPPKHERFSRTEDYVEVECEGFDVRDSVTADVRLTTFFDRDGTEVRKTWHETGVDHLYNSEDSDKFIEGKYTFTQQIDLLTGEQTYNGLFWHFVIPGYGNFYFLSGHYILNSDGEFIFGRGRQNFDETLLCNLLG